MHVQPDQHPCCLLHRLHNSYTFYSFIGLLKAFAKCLDQDQGQQNVSPDLDSTRLTL